MIDSDFVFDHMILHKVEIKFKMLSFGMENWIGYQKHNSQVIIVDFMSSSQGNL